MINFVLFKNCIFIAVNCKLTHKNYLFSAFLCVSESIKTVPVGLRVTCVYLCSMQWTFFSFLSFTLL